jgi:hypothetical protein
MPTLAYLNSGQSITAAGMNSLFAEMDRKTRLALDGHSILYLLQTERETARTKFRPYLGPVFAFANGPRPISGFWAGNWGLWSYDHSIFTNAVDSATIYSGLDEVYSPTQKWVRINPLPGSLWDQIGQGNGILRSTFDFLGFSLEAHKKAYTPPGGVEEMYWVAESHDVIQISVERIRNYQQAELVFEGGVTELDFLGAWNKYNFFRIHVCQAEAVTVRFRNSAGGIAHTVTVGGYGSQCVRRTGVDGAYTDGFHYFQRFVSGDPRFYQHGTCNNVTNPSIIIPFVNEVLAGGVFAAPTVMLNPQVRAPLPSGYKFGDPSSPATLLGDCLHHRGVINEVDSSVTPNTPTVTGRSFDGYASLPSMAGVSMRTVGDDLQIKASGGGTRDFMSLTTNLLCTNGDRFINKPIRDASDWITLDRHMPARPFVTALELTSSTRSLSYNTVLAGGALGPLVTQSIESGTVKMAGQYPKDSLLPHVTTVGEVIQRVADSAAICSFESTTMALTSSGLVLNTTQTIPLTHPFGPADSSVLAQSHPDYALNNHLASTVIPVLSANLRHHIELDGGNLVIKRCMVFDGYGFPDTDNWPNTGFLSPRFTRIYSDRPLQPLGLPFSGTHPDFSEGARNVTGQDAVYKGNRGSFNQTGIAVLSPYNSASGLGAGDYQYTTQGIGTMTNNDVLIGAWLSLGTPQFWSQNRTRLLNNEIHYSNSFNDPDGACHSHTPGQVLALDIRRFWRMRMEIEHYNNLAAKVNSMARYRPLNWIDHGVIQNGSDQTLRYRLIPNRRGIFDEIRTTSFYTALSQAGKDAYNNQHAQLSGLRPATQFASAELLTDSTMIVAGYAGLNVLGLVDLPDNFVALAQKPGRNTIAKATASATVTGQISDPPGSLLRFRFEITPNSLSLASFSTSETGKSRNDLASVVKYHWLSIGDVEAYAVSRGYKFLHGDIGPGYALEEFNADAFNISLPPAYISQAYNTSINFVGRQLVSDYPPGALSVPSRSHPYTVAFTSRFVEFVAGATWIAGDGAKAIERGSTDWSSRVYARTNFQFPVNQPYGPSNNSDDYAPVYEPLLMRMIVPENPDGYGFVVPLSPFLFELDLPKRLRERFFNAIPGAIKIEAASKNPSGYTTSLLCESAMIQQSGGDLSVVSYPVEALEFVEDWSEQSALNRSGLWRNGVGVLPFTVGTGNRVQLWSDFTAPFDA